MEQIMEMLKAMQEKADADRTTDREQLLAEIRAVRTTDREQMLPEIRADRTAD
jgi:hypothetical protein